MNHCCLELTSHCDTPLRMSIFYEFMTIIRHHGRGEFMMFHLKREGDVIGI